MQHLAYLQAEAETVAALALAPEASKYCQVLDEAAQVGQGSLAEGSAAAFLFATSSPLEMSPYHRHWMPLEWSPAGVKRSAI